MSTILSASAPTSFEIKSANLPLVALLLKSTDLEQLSRELAQRFGDMPDFFDNDPLVVDLTPLTAGESEGLSTALDFAALIDLLRSYRLQPLAVRGGSDAQTEAALSAGLIQAQDAMVQRSVPQREASAEPVHEPPQVSAPQPAVAQAAPAPALAAMVIDKPLRSGQQVYARGRDLVVMAMVNPGAEVIADGHIHVYAPLRGKAIAGARGNADARIFALVMEPELISIAGIYRTSENALPDSVQGKAAQVALAPDDDGTDKLVIKPIGA
ncbi:septum site-determining protein MinC [Hydrogenophaga crassostreae]|uniref:Probable septum site-determining protein MinC n=1 Tax=Hydrogenophaga crassostreae TaxID=1763535 RepID=A0A167GF69_9BURK|nr:septum site-determining protein MinC [Hydrogenophaga crassostreae]AOW11531.1 septum site-determining protein MinC [Hydrogenophaga crassostreae]OAD39369.1 septum site-determining protein MinC [Hydrogenophaga crassostreae]